MLFDVKDLSKKELMKRVEEGDQEALFEIATHYFYEDDLRVGLAEKYFTQIISKECNCQPENYLRSLIIVGTFHLDREEFEQAYNLFKRAKEFMEKALSEEDWDTDLFQYLSDTSKLLELKKEASQKAFYQLGCYFQDGEMGIENDEIAAKYFEKVIAEKCIINKQDYVHAYVFVGYYLMENGEVKGARKYLQEAKVFMESNLSEKDWYLPLYDYLKESKVRLLEQQ